MKSIKPRSHGCNDFWQNPANYEHLQSDCRYHFIAWEFLRRNPEYQKDISAFNAEREAWFSAHPDAVKWLESVGESSCFYVALDSYEYEDAPAIFSEWCGIGRKWKGHFREKWRLLIPTRPDDDAHGEEFQYDIDGRKEEYLNPLYEDGIGPLYIDRERVLLPINLSISWRDAKKILEHDFARLRKQAIQNGVIEAKPFRLLAPAVYVQHLRILDARESGADFQQIGAVLLPHAVNTSDEKQRDKRIRAAYFAAMKMRNQGWKNLIHACK